MKNIIFHIPFKTDIHQPSGTNIRPLKMIRAFQNIGYHVDVVMGFGKERKKIIKQIKAKIKKGVKYEFLYAENHTLPTILTEKNHFPSYPFLDYSFFFFCKRNNIPLGLFYRDIYWNFKSYKLKGIKAFLTKLAYRLDLIIYNNVLKSLFLPSFNMLEYVPKKFDIDLNELPPGHAIPIFEAKPKSEKLELLYIGGIGSHYQMIELFKSIPKLRDVNFTICTREKEWLGIKNDFKDYIQVPNLNIVHVSGEKLECLYLQSDIALLFVEPVVYWEFAVPIKLFEYLGHRKPIIASKGTYANDFVEKNNIGWSIDYKSEQLVELLNHLSSNRAEVIQKNEILEKVATNNTWEKRAEKVALILKK